MIGIVFILISNIFALYPAEFVRHAFDSIEAGMQEDKIELANFYIKNLLPFCNVESSIATLGANNLYENVNSIF